MNRGRLLFLLTVLLVAVLSYLAIPTLAPSGPEVRDPRPGLSETAILAVVTREFLLVEWERLVGMSRSAAALEPTMLEQSVAFCDTPSDASPLGCIQKWHAQSLPSLADRVSASGKPRMLREFWERNRKPRLLTEALDGVTFLTAPQVRERVRANNLGAVRTAVAGVSLPGLSGDGHALVYVTMHCGTACGYNWFVLLRSERDIWHVLATGLAAIS